MGSTLKTAPLPAPLERPKLATFLWERDISSIEAARALGRTREWLRLILLPFSDSRRRIPDSADLEKIHIWTKGEIRPADFYPLHLNLAIEASDGGGVVPPNKRALFGVVTNPAGSSPGHDPVTGEILDEKEA